MKFEAFSEVGNFNSSELIQEVEKLNILITLKKTKKRCQLSLKKKTQQKTGPGPRECYREDL